MKKHFKRGIALLFVAIIAFSLCACGEGDDFIKPTEAFFVNDFADVITPEDEQIICAQGKALQENTKAQAVIVTVDSLDGQAIEDYAYEIGENWALGDKEEDNGIVILLSVSDREYRVEVGSGLEGALPDSKTGRIMDHYAAPKLATDDFSGALLDVYNAITNEIYLEYGIETTPNYIPVENLPKKQEESSAGKVIISWVVMVGIVALYIIFFGGRGGLFIFGAPRFYGGFGGGSSGGFGGFSGGGGSFGGGGASRKF
ncbi:MAG: TPM domain-containing protein [Clostridia bacterium]|nr:TPM domain-containing protein [Clostridia bacterium]